MRMMRRIAGSIALIALASAAGAQGAATPTPEALTLAEIIQLKKSRVSTSRILESAREYCIAFVVDDAAERELRAAGADDQLLDGLRQSCGPRPLVVKREDGMTAGATLFSDDFRKTTRLPVAASSQPCRSRYGDDGFTMASAVGTLGCTLAYPSAPIEGDVRIEMHVAVVSPRDGTVSLGFGRAAGSSDRVSVNLQGNGRYEVCRFVGQRCVRLRPPAQATSANRAPRGENRLAVEIRGQTLRILLNDEQVVEIADVPDLSGFLVLGVGPNTTATFRLLRVSRLTS